MPLRDLLKKKDRISNSSKVGGVSTANAEELEELDLDVPTIKFLRSTTHSEEALTLPEYPEDKQESAEASNGKDKPPKSKNLFRRSRKLSQQENTTAELEEGAAPAAHDSKAERIDAPAKSENRLSRRLEKLHIRSHSRSPSANSVHVPTDLPDIQDEDQEDQWEKRATLLAQTSGPNGRPPSSEEMGMGPSFSISQHDQHHHHSTPSSSSLQLDKQAAPSLTATPAAGAAPPRSRAPSDPIQSDSTIQEAIRLHEAGHLDKSTAMFGYLADPEGENNALAQVLYGLALRHGWGTEAAPERALTFLAQAASNAASVESAALGAGLAKGGAAKGELVLAIYELANSYRHGWGVDKDPVAARHYYETAANLGDTDAMSEVAWCYVHGFGGKKDKFAAAKYLRMAEAKGVKVVGESWIWKEKYNPKQPPPAPPAV